MKSKEKIHRELMSELFFFLDLTGLADLKLERSRPRYTANCRKYLAFRRICNKRVWDSEYVLSSDCAEICTGY